MVEYTEEELLTQSPTSESPGFQGIRRKEAGKKEKRKKGVVSKSFLTSERKEETSDGGKPNDRRLRSLREKNSMTHIKITLNIHGTRWGENQWDEA
ncbi:hypothetical protein RUM43_007056 [Polyplax serrata]|uniref:Uncharacterized protein n=1 Tax=Polyplax serrata TaxID=468196 RepID=A0AAN8PLH3_POLSC